jgi:hypothetical protein
MITIIPILFFVVIALLGLMTYRAARSQRTVIAANGTGVHHGGRVTRVSVGAIATRYLIVKQSGTALGVEACTATAHPLGIVTDEADDADSPVMVIMPGSAETTVKLIPSVAILAGDVLYTAAAGKVTNVPVAGSFIVGTALAAGAADEELEVDPAGFGVPYKA